MLHVIITDLSACRPTLRSKVSFHGSYRRMW